MTLAVSLPDSRGGECLARRGTTHSRLRAGQTTTQDINFYMHELKESAVFRRTSGADAYETARAAHMETLEWQGIEYAPGYESQLYAPEVIQQYSEFFNPAALPK